MFSLKHHVRRHAMMVAAIAATTCLAAASHAATIYWDYNGNGEGGAGDLDNTTGSFVDSGSIPYTLGSGLHDVVFAGAGGDVIMKDSIAVNKLQFGLDLLNPSSGYVFKNNCSTHAIFAKNIKMRTDCADDLGA